MTSPLVTGSSAASVSHCILSAYDTAGLVLQARPKHDPNLPNHTFQKETGPVRQAFTTT